MNDALGIWGILIALWLAATTLVQALYVLVYRRRFLHNLRWPAPPPKLWPRAAVLLTVRGSDPNLPRCLAGLDQLDYPDFEIHVGLDHPEDSARVMIEAHRTDANRQVHLHIMPPPQSPGGLKCERLVTLIDALGPGVAIVALVDADTVPPADWLRQLVAPLEDPAVGIATGNRWYEPVGNWPTIVRSIWNAAAIVQMHLYDIPWGGSLALRRETIETLGLRKLWLRSFCEDTVLSEVLKRNGLRIERPSGLVLDNSESTTTSGLVNWLTRQLLTVRLYHRAWPWVAVHGVANMLMPLAVAAGLACACWSCQWTTAAVIALSYAAYVVLNLVLMAAVSSANWESLGQPHAPSPPSPLGKRTLLCALLVPVTQCIHGYCLMRAMLARRVTWRGISYRLGREGVARVDYRVYRGDNSGHSIH